MTKYLRVVSACLDKSYKQLHADTDRILHQTSGPLSTSSSRISRTRLLETTNDGRVFESIIFDENEDGKGPGRKQENRPRALAMLVEDSACLVAYWEPASMVVICDFMLANPRRLRKNRDWKAVTGL
jgi:hypothetical protein